MKYYELDKDEQEILKAFERGEFVPVKDSEKLKKKYREYARYTLRKNKNINIRLSIRDLHKLKAKAAREGIPYQTLAGSIIHKYSNDLIE